MLGQKFVTRTRRLFDRALTSLPVTQHERVWPLYLKASVWGLVEMLASSTRSTKLFSEHGLQCLQLQCLQQQLSSPEHKPAPSLLQFIGQPGIPVETAVRVGGAEDDAGLSQMLPLARWVTVDGSTASSSHTNLCKHKHPPFPLAALPQVYRRYLKLEPTHAEEFIAYLKIKQLWGEAARVRAAWGAGGLAPGGKREGLAKQCHG